MDLPHNIYTSWNLIQLKYDQTIRITLHAQHIQKKIMVLTFHSNLFIYNMYIIKIPDYFYPTKWRYISYHRRNLIGYCDNIYTTKVVNRIHQITFIASFCNRFS